MLRWPDEETSATEILAPTSRRADRRQSVIVAAKLAVDTETVAECEVADSGKVEQSAGKFEASPSAVSSGAPRVIVPQAVPQDKPKTAGPAKPKPSLFRVKPGVDPRTGAVYGEVPKAGTVKPAAPQPKLLPHTQALDDSIGGLFDEDQYAHLKNSKAKANYILSKEEMLDISDKAFQFCLMSTGVELYPYQEEFGKRMVQSVLLEDADTLTALFSRQSGKTEVVAVITVGLIVLLPKLAAIPNLALDSRISKFKQGFWVGIFAPIYEQAATLHGRMLARMGSKTMRQTLRDPDIAIDPKEGRAMLHLPTGSFVDCMSAAPGTNIEGKTYHLIITEETQDITDYKMKKCLAGDTTIYTLQGRQELRTLHSKPSLPQVTIAGKEAAQDEYEFHDNGVQEIVAIATSNGRELHATKAHRWLVRRRKGDRTPQIVTTEQLVVGDTVAVPERWRVERVGDSSYNRGVLLGAILGDGCTTGDSVQFCGHRDFIDHLQRAAFVAFQMRLSEYKEAPSGLIECILTSYEYRNPLKAWLRYIGVLGLKGAGKKVPEFVFTESQDFQKGLVIGLIETDGSIVLGQKPHISFDNISKQLVDALADILWQYGVHVSRSVRPNDSGFGKTHQPLYTLRVKGAHDIRQFARFFTLVTKQKVLDKLLEMLSSGPRHGKGRGVPHNMRFVRITSIEPRPPVDTYCLTIPNQTFFANGLLSLNSIHPMGAATGATIIKIGTPSIHKADFYNTTEQNRQKDLTYSHVRGYLKIHYEYDFRTAIKYNYRYRKYIQKEIERLGYDSDEFRMAYRLHWLVERGQFITTEILEGCAIKQRDVVKRKDASGEMVRFSRSDHVSGSDRHTEGQVAAIDIGRGDSTVITVAKVMWASPVQVADQDHPYRYFTHIESWLEIQGDDHEEQYPQIKQFLANYNLRAVIVDSTGRGDPVRSRLKADLEPDGIDVYGFVFSMQSKHKGYTVLYKEMRDRRLTFPAGESVKKLQKWRRFYQQMSDLEKNWKGKYMSPEAPKQRTAEALEKAHDDYPDSVMMLAHLVNCMQVAIEGTATNPFFEKNSSSNFALARAYGIDAMRKAMHQRNPMHRR